MVRVVKGGPAGWGVCSRTTQLSSITWTLSHHGNSVAVGSEPGDITIIDVITGSQSAVLSGHTELVGCVVFSSDGRSLVSGSWDRTIKLWDVQTGGVVKTFFGHTGRVLSVSISADCTTVASGSGDRTICSWNVQTGECYHIIQNSPAYLILSPTDPQHLMSISNDKVWQWDTNGCLISHPFDSSYAAFSSDGTQFVSCFKRAITVRNSSSGAIATEFQAVDYVHRCCFSPDNRLVAVAVDKTAYCWDITTSEPKLVETFIGHAERITSLVFSSSTTLISASQDKSVKFWQIGAQLTDPPIINLNPASLPSAPIKSVTLQSKEGIVITYHSDDVIKTWDISTGICKASCQTPAQGSHMWDTRLVDGRLIFVWYIDNRIHAWDGENGELLWEVSRPWGVQEPWEVPESWEVSKPWEEGKPQKVGKPQGVSKPQEVSKSWEVGKPWGDRGDIRISGDGFRVFALYAPSIWAWSLQTGEVVWEMEIGYGGNSGSLIVDGSKVWACWLQSNYKGWDFCIPGLTPVGLSNISTPPSPRFRYPNQARIENPATGEVVFQLSGRFANSVSVQCDDFYLVAGHGSGEMLILDLTNVK